MLERLREAVDLREIRHLLLSHIHLDHAGAAGHVVAANPQIRVHVSEIGAPHVVDPSRLIASARRLYGDDLDRLYGEPLPVPQDNVEVIWDVAAGLKSFATTGTRPTTRATCSTTARCSRATRLECASSRASTSSRTRLRRRSTSKRGSETFDEILRHQPEQLALIHFGVVSGVEDVAEHVQRTRDYLAVWAERVRGGMGEQDFVAAARADLEASEGEGAGAYLRAAPFNQSYLGLERYWRKKRERDAEATAST